MNSDSKEDSIPESLVYSESALQIVTDPFLVGSPLLHLAKESCKDFIQSLDLTNLRGPYCVLNILRGGRYYRLIDAWNETANLKGDTPLELAEIRAKRQVDDNGEWTCKIWHDADISVVSEEESKENLLKCNTLIIGDTVATAATLKGVLQWFIDLRATNNVEGPLDIAIFSICGSSVAKKNLYPFYDEICKPKEVGIQLVLANAGYKLDEENGTDLSLVTTEMVPEAKEYIEKRIGDKFMERMKCAIWDWGDRFNSIQSHLKEVLEYFEQFVDDEDLPEHIRESVIMYKEGIDVADEVNEDALNVKWGENRYSLVIAEEKKVEDKSEEPEEEAQEEVKLVQQADANQTGIEAEEKDDESNSEKKQQEDCCIIQ